MKSHQENGRAKPMRSWPKTAVKKWRLGQGIHLPLNIQEFDLVIQVAGHMRANFCCACDRSLLPAGVRGFEVR